MRNGERLVTLGEINGVFGVQGWVKVWSATEPRERILEYGPWRLRMADGDWREIAVLDGRRHGQTVVACLEGIEDRDQARALNGAEIAVTRSRLPPPGEGEYYWTDLEGLRVVTLDDHDLGRVQGLLRTGANDVMVVAGERERLVPFVLERYVREVDFEAGVIRVDWDPED